MKMQGGSELEHLNVGGNLQIPYKEQLNTHVNNLRGKQTLYKPHERFNFCHLNPVDAMMQRHISKRAESQKSYFSQHLRACTSQESAVYKDRNKSLLLATSETLPLHAATREQGEIQCIIRTQSMPTCGCHKRPLNPWKDILDWKSQNVL